MSSTTTHSPIKVTATDRGYFGDRMRQAGDEFEIDSAEQFSFRWMKSEDDRVRPNLAERNAK